MFGLGMPELIIILVIVTVLFGAKRLPELGKGIGQAIRNFKASTDKEVGEIEAAVKKPTEEQHT